MTIQELLQKIFNATEEQVTSFTEAMRNNKIFTSAEENIDVRYGKLKTQHGETKTQLDAALGRIAEFEKAANGQDVLIKENETLKAEKAQLEADLKKTRIESGVRVAVLESGAKNVDYIMYLLTNGGDLEEGEDGKVKGLADKIAALKTQQPDQFSSGGRKYEEHKLPGGDDPGAGGEPKNLADALRMQYEENPN